MTNLKKRFSRTKRFLIGFIVLFLIVGIYWAFFSQPDAPEYATAVVERGHLKIRS